ncbi:MAG: thymidylate synthase [Nanoarchaeota archaeon]|nr:thymidylate synthase [Nanoarchaeota archaeon]
MEQYHELLKRILGHGDVQFEPRTQEYILGISAWQSVYDLREGFPLVTTKNVPSRLPFEELFWKLRGERNVKSLVDKKVHIWTANAFDRYLKINGLQGQFPKHSQQWNEEFEIYKDRLAKDSNFAGAGDLGPVYGFQWRHWKNSGGKEIDQLANLLAGIPKKPGSRYHVLSSWNVGDLPDMAIGPCPFWHQFSVFGKNMDLTTVQRSCDVFLGVPFNIAQDSLLVHMVANETGFEPRFFNHSYVNVHSYLGVPPRAYFWTDKRNVGEFQKRFKGIEDKSKYLDLRKWYIINAPPESPGNEKKDHIPFILEQLSKTPKELPSIKIKSGTPLLEAIQMPALDYAEILNYNPEKWDSKAEMAA